MKQSRLNRQNGRNVGSARARFIVISVFFLAFCVIFLGRLVNLQFASKEIYESSNLNANSYTVEIPTTRGIITDVNGVPLVKNEISYNITLDKDEIPGGKENTTVFAVINYFLEKKIEIIDLLPVQNTAPYRLDADYYENSQSQRYVKNFANYFGRDYSEFTKTDTALYEALYKRYGMSKFDATEQEKRLIVGLRFTLDTTAYSSNLPCVLVENANEQIIGSIADSINSFDGLSVSTSAKRVYTFDSLAAHLLGRTGVIFAEEADYYREKGYNLTETVGKSGAEYAFEDYLQSRNGKLKITKSEDGKTVLGEDVTVEPKNGLTVRLTIDAQMQRVAEESLERVIKAQARAGKNTYLQYDGEDANAGAVVVMERKTGAVRVSATYPTYNQNTYSEDFNTLRDDTENRPLLNRATSGFYEPGSTYKLATAAAALHYGVTTMDRLIYDKGEFEDYPTYKPHCWVLDRHGYTHGYQNVLSAIQNSCNYYFFRVGKEMGIEKLVEYTKSLGLGVKTGIEIGEEAGIVASPEYKESVGLAWNPGDTLQAAIGQQHLFTPLQLASYTATLLNGGTRYRAHIFDSAQDFATGETVEKYEPEILSQIEIPQDVLSMLKEGMRRVIDDGTASATFVGYKYPVGGKTGTAQVSKGSDNVIFVGFAPYDDPEIVVSVVLEHGEKSGNAAQIAKDIFDCYFSRLYPEDFGIAAIDDMN